MTYILLADSIGGSRQPVAVIEAETEEKAWAVVEENRLALNQTKDYVLEPMEVYK